MDENEAQTAFALLSQLSWSGETIEHRPLIGGIDVFAMYPPNMVPPNARRWWYRVSCACGASTAPGMVIPWGIAMFYANKHVAAERANRASADQIIADAQRRLHPNGGADA